MLRKTATASDSASAGNVVYNGAKRVRRSEARVLFEFEDGEDDFYASKIDKYYDMELYLKRASRAR
jgi:hypothetical protein